MENNPYAPSASSLGATAPIVEDTATGFGDISGISSKLSVLLVIGGVWRALAVVSSFMQYHLLSNPPYTMAQATANDMRERLMVFGSGVLFVITAIVFGRWIYRAHKNLPELGVRHPHFTPGWAVGCFFVPIVNLWAPYQAMRDLAKGSRSPRQWELEDTPVLIVIWWILWLLVEFTSNAVFQMSARAHSLQALQEATVLRIVSGTLAVPQYFLARYIVRRVWRDQSETFAQMGNVSA